MKGFGLWVSIYPAPYSDHLREPKMSRRHAYSLVGKTVSILTGQRLMGRWGLPGVGSADLQNTARWTTAGMLGAAFADVLGSCICGGAGEALALSRAGQPMHY